MDAWQTCNGNRNRNAKLLPGSWLSDCLTLKKLTPSCLRRLADACYMRGREGAASRSTSITWSCLSLTLADDVASVCAEKGQRGDTTRTLADGWWASYRNNRNQVPKLMFNQRFELNSGRLMRHNSSKIFLFSEWTNAEGRKKPIRRIPRKPWMRERLNHLHALLRWPHSATHRRHEKQNEWKKMRVG